jgi:hypothetical protein
MSTASTFGFSKLPLGAIIKMGDAPIDGKFLPTGTVVQRSSYPELSAAFPDPKLRNASDVNAMKLGTAQANKYVKVKY